MDVVSLFSNHNLITRACKRKFELRFRTDLDRCACNLTYLANMSEPIDSMIQVGSMYQHCEISCVVIWLINLRFVPFQLTRNLTTISELPQLVPTVASLR